MLNSFVSGIFIEVDIFFKIFVSINNWLFIFFLVMKSFSKFLLLRDGGCGLYM